MKDDDDLIGKKCLLYALQYNTIILLREYIKNLNLRYDLVSAFPETIHQYRQESFKKILFINSVFDETLMTRFPNAEICILNIDSITNEWTIKNIIDTHDKYPNLRIYDYNKENLRLLLDTYHISNTQYLEYIYDENEVEPLKQLYHETEKTYDFGIIAYTQDLRCSFRRNVMVNRLRHLGFTVNVASGFEKKRDMELSKCKIILNIHGKSENQSLPTLMFEHLRCNRLLYAGFQILSEPSIIDYEFSTRFPNLKFIRSYDFLKITHQHIDEFHFKELEIDKEIRLSKEWTRLTNEEEFCNYPLP